MASRAPIYMVVIGVHRQVLEQGLSHVLENTPYELSAILDLVESPAALQYTPENLAVVLNALYPRPRVLITGTAIPDEMLTGVESTWEQYVNQWNVDGIYVPMSKTHPSPGAPPPPGAVEHAIQLLDQKFLRQ